jgi:hypothetical protein
MIENRSGLLQAIALTATIVCAVAAPASSQTTPPPATKPPGLSGPRFGATFLSNNIVRKLAEDDDIDVASVVSQFGWQFEKQFHTTDTGPTLVTEWVLLVGGTEQGVFLPSLSWLIGMRTLNGVEFGVGPNLTPVGSALVIAAGRTFHAGGLNLPVNLAIVPSRVTRQSFGGPPNFPLIETHGTGLRVSVLFGFSRRS